MANEDVCENILKFAQLKLINYKLAKSKDGLTESQSLACLSVRMALEFNSTTFTAHSQEQEQVEGYMPICLMVNDSFETMKTVSASEPLSIDLICTPPVQNSLS